MEAVAHARARVIRDWGNAAITPIVSGRGVVKDAKRNDLAAV